MPKSGEYYVREARKAGLTVKHGRGDHVKVYGPAGRGFTVIPMHRELANGTEHVIIKFFKALGILLIIPALCACSVLLLK